jgi:hypothetical protein
MKYIHTRITFYQSIRIGFGIAIGIAAFKLLALVVISAISIMLSVPPIQFLTW